MREIQLTQGKIAIIDDEDFERLNAFKWYVYWDGWNWYAVRKVRKNGKQRAMPIHRVIMNAPDGMYCDHINGNGLDNRKANLRLCTNRQNCSNKKQAQKNNKLGVKGVNWHKQHQKFQAKIQCNGKAIHLGYYNVLGDADSAYRFAEEKYFGEFARNHNK